MFAHSRNGAGQRNLLIDHLTETARLTAEFAEPLGAAALGPYVGLWHDVGKFDPAWQRYLLDAEAGRVARGCRFAVKRASSAGNGDRGKVQS